MVERFNPNYSAYTAQCMHKADRGSWVRAADYDALTEERDRLKQWQADQVEAIDEAKALITELNADKKALEAERDRLKEIVDGTGLATAAIAAERDRLAKANAELKPLLQNIGDGIANMFDQLVKGNWRDDHDHDVKMNVHMLNLHDVLKQIMRFRADYLDYSEPDFTKHKATSTEREGE